MSDIATFRRIALSFPGTIEQPHFDRIAFKVTGKRIFATLLEENKSVNLKLSMHEQNIFCTYNKKAVYPVNNKFGLQGWTTFELDEIPEEVISEALYSSYLEAAGKSKK